MRKIKMKQRTSIYVNEMNLIEKKKKRRSKTNKQTH